MRLCLHKKKKQGQLVEMSGLLAETPVLFLIDGGSTITLLAKSMLDRIAELGNLGVQSSYEIQRYPLEKWIFVEVGSGEAVLVKEGVYLSGIIDEREFQFFFSIFEPKKGVFECLIGRDFMELMNLACVPM